MEPDEYIIGEPNAPYWCKNRIMPFKRGDGSVGYEFHDGKIILILKAGDVLLRGQDKRINVRKKR